MTKKILITGATSGIGRDTAHALSKQGHHLLVHGRSASKVDALVAELSGIEGAGPVEGFVADLSKLAAVRELAVQVTSRHDELDVIVNNAGVLKIGNPITPEGQDVRFVVNTLAPYILTERLMPLVGKSGRIVNLSSAAQKPVNLGALNGSVRLAEFDAYAQSKLALTMWSCSLGRHLGGDGPIVLAVNPGSLLATKMVKEGFGVAGKDISIGSGILVRACLSDEFIDKTGAYFDNDAGRLAPPHPDALDEAKCAAVVKAIEALANAA